MDWKRGEVASNRLGLELGLGLDASGLSKVPSGLGLGLGEAGAGCSLVFFHNKQDCGGNALSHSIALPLAIAHTRHHYIPSYRYFITLLVTPVVLLIAVVHHFSSCLPYAS